MAENVLPMDTSGEALLKVQASSKLAFGATTVALVALASSGTAVLVNHGTSSMAGPTALPGGALLPDGGSATGSVVVDRAPGTYGAKPVVTKIDPTVKALRAALAHRAKPGKRTLIAPLVRLGGTVAFPAIGTPDSVVPAVGVPEVVVPEVVVPAVDVPEVGVPAVGVPAVGVPAVGPAHPTVTLPPPRKPAKPAKGAPTDAKPAITLPDRSALPHNGPVATPADRPDTDDQETRKGGSKHPAGKNKAESKAESRADSRDKSERSDKGKSARGRHSR